MHPVNVDSKVGRAEGATTQSVVHASTVHLRIMAHLAADTLQKPVLENHGWPTRTTSVTSLQRRLGLTDKYSI